MTVFSERLLAAARDFEARTGAHFHLLRVQPSRSVDAREIPFRFQAVISGATDQRDHALIGCGFDVEGTRPIFHPRTCMEFDSLEAVSNRFNQGGTLDRAQILYAFGTVDADAESRVLHVDRSFPFLGLVDAIRGDDPALPQARGMAWSIALEDLRRVVETLESRRANSGSLIGSLDRSRLLTCLGAVKPQAVFAEALEAKVGPTSTSGIVSSIVRLADMLREQNLALRQSDVEFTAKRLFSDMERRGNTSMPTPPRAATPLEPLFSMR